MHRFFSILPNPLCDPDASHDMLHLQFFFICDRCATRKFLPSFPVLLLRYNCALEAKFTVLCKFPTSSCASVVRHIYSCPKWRIVSYAIAMLWRVSLLVSFQFFLSSSGAMCQLLLLVQVFIFLIYLDHFKFYKLVYTLFTLNNITKVYALMTLLTSCEFRYTSRLTLNVY